MRAVFADASLARDLTPKPETQLLHGQALSPHPHQSSPSHSHSHSHSSSPQPPVRPGSAEPLPRPSSSSDLRSPVRLRMPGGGLPALLVPPSLSGSRGAEGESCVCHRFVMVVFRCASNVFQCRGPGCARLAALPRDGIGGSGGSIWACRSLNAGAKPGTNFVLLRRLGHPDLGLDCRPCSRSFASGHPIPVPFYLFSPSFIPYPYIFFLIAFTALICRSLTCTSRICSNPYPQPSPL
ncbi:hypothetical protein LXA43DRAFT_238169 [Ganoderma leucocontextum]|nr:hypothetical protein LXA43DRAFT_238169 [Ganoderma leucocontextum]